MAKGTNIPAAQIMTPSNSMDLEWRKIVMQNVMIHTLNADEDACGRAAVKRLSGYGRSS